MRSFEEFLKPAIDEYRAMVWNAAYDVIEAELQSSGNTGKALKMAHEIVEKLFGEEQE